MAVHSWYAVQTKPRWEEQVFHRLATQKSVPVFMPKLESLRRWGRRTVRSLEPLFPSYLFVRMSLTPDEWYAVKWTPGVKRIVGTGDVPVPVPDEAIDLLKARCEKEGFIAWTPTLRSGSPVRIANGPFAGLTGVLDRPASRTDRVRVLLSLLRTVAAVEVDLLDLEEVSL